MTVPRFPIKATFGLSPFLGSSLHPSRIAACYRKLRWRPKRRDNGISPALMMWTVTSVNNRRPLGNTYTTGNSVRKQSHQRSSSSSSHHGRRAKTDDRTVREPLAEKYEICCSYVFPGTL